MTITTRASQRGSVCVALLFACAWPSLAQFPQRAYFTAKPEFQYVRQMQSVGVTNLQTGIELTEWWVGTNQFDFAATDRRLRQALEYMPGGRLMLRVGMAAPAWWLTGHLDQVILAPAGMVTYQASLASQAWRDATAQAFSAWLEHLRQIGLLAAIDDIVIWAGPAGENAYDWGVAEPKRALFDYSKPCRDLFRERTGGDIPSAERRLAASDMDFRDPVAMRDVVEYQRLLSQVMAESLTCVAGAIKRATGGRVRVGAFYGYTLLPGWRPWEQHTTGHLALGTLLASPNIDFVAAPYGYAERGPGGVFCGQAPLDSISVAGKQAWIEDDTRTHRRAIYDMGLCLTPAASVAVAWRNWAGAATHGANFWWTELGPQGTYDSPELLRCIADQLVADRWLEQQNQPRQQAEVAVITSEDGVLVSRTGPELTAPFITHPVVKDLLRFGTPVDFYRLDDVARMPDYRLYVFLNSFYVTTSVRQAWHAKLAHNKATALWVHAAGYGSEKGLSVESMRELTGIAFRRHAIRAIPEVRITNADDPITRPPQGAGRYGSSLATGPLFSALPDASMRTLGLLRTTFSADPSPEVEAEGPGLVVAPQAGWTSIWSAAPQLPPWLLRRIARQAGVHVYVDSDDWVAADGRVLAVHAGASGHRRIALPKARAIYDLQKRQVVARHTAVLECDLAYGETAVFLLADRARDFAALGQEASLLVGEVELWAGNEAMWRRESNTATFVPVLEWPVGHALRLSTGVPLTVDVRDGMGRLIRYTLPAGEQPALLDLALLHAGLAGSGSLTMRVAGSNDWAQVRNLAWVWAPANAAKSVHGVLQSPAIPEWFVSDPIPDPKQRRLDCQTALDEVLTNAPGPIGRERLERLCKWTRVTPEGSVVMLPAGTSPVPSNNVVAVAWTELTLASPRRVKFGVGSDDGVRIWVNGRQVLDRPVERALTPDEDVVDVDLVAGRNEIVVKCSQSYGGWAFAVDIDGMDERAVTPGPVR